jgi:hypothetical protein
MYVHIKLGILSPALEIRHLFSSFHQFPVSPQPERRSRQQYSLSLQPSFAGGGTLQKQRAPLVKSAPLQQRGQA